MEGSPRGLYVKPLKKPKGQRVDVARIRADERHRLCLQVWINPGAVNGNVMRDMIGLQRVDPYPFNIWLCLLPSKDKDEVADAKHYTHTKSTMVRTV